MSNVVETLREGAYTVELVLDEYPENPRKEWDHFGTMVCKHRRYDLGDREPDSTEEEALTRGGLRLLRRYLRRYCGMTKLLVLGLIDHSGISMYVGGGAHPMDTGGWDSGTVGVIFDTAQSRKESGVALADVEKVLIQEVEEYDQFLTGDVYAYVLTKRAATCGHAGCEDEAHMGEVFVDACGGFYGYDYALQEAREALEAAVKGQSAA